MYIGPPQCPAQGTVTALVLLPLLGWDSPGTIGLLPDWAHLASCSAMAQPSFSPQGASTSVAAFCPPQIISAVVEYDVILWKNHSHSKLLWLLWPAASKQLSRTFWFISRLPFKNQQPPWRKGERKKLVQNPNIPWQDSEVLQVFCSFTSGMWMGLAATRGCQGTETAIITSSWFLVITPSTPHGMTSLVEARDFSSLETQIVLLGTWEFFVWSFTKPLSTSEGRGSS